MPLESTMICLDNSEWMRNGDYIPTRMEAQHDAANLLCGTKTQSNPESTVGVLTMAGKGPELLVSPTDDMGKILSSLHGVPIHGKTNFAAGIQIAQEERPALPVTMVFLAGRESNKWWTH